MVTICTLILTDIDISSRLFDLTSSSSPNCISFSITDDEIIESTEYFSVTLVQGSMEVQFVYETATIVIIDNDSKICKIPKFIIDSIFWLPL